MGVSRKQVKLLSWVDVLESLSKEELEELAELCPDIRLRRGEDFFHSEEHDGGLFFIKEGRVRVYKVTPAGKQLTTDLLGGGTVLWARRLEGLHAQATEPTVLAFMSRPYLDRFILSKPAVGLRMMDLLAERLRLSNERMAEVAHKGVLPRLAGHLLRLIESEGIVDRGGYVLPAAYTHQELGWMIGATRVAVTRALKELREAGAVEMEKRRIRIRDTEVLERIARTEE
jgi:CRP/FNR family cyclic AMP-dependent transcriptional regulator